MTQKVKMISLSAHKYGRDHLGKDDPFYAHPRDVKLLKALGRAEEFKGELTETSASLQEKPAQQIKRPAVSKKPSNNRPPKSRQYNRRDMKAKR